MKTINKAVLSILLMTVGCGAAPDDAASSGEAKASEVITQELSTAEERTIVDDGSLTGNAAPQGVQPNLLATQCGISFINTCRGYWANWQNGTAIVSAGASSCRRRNGTWTSWSPQYHGTCYTDVANIDGTLLCVGG